MICQEFLSPLSANQSSTLTAFALHSTPGEPVLYIAESVEYWYPIWYVNTARVGRMALACYYVRS